MVRPLIAAALWVWGPPALAGPYLGGGGHGHRFASRWGGGAHLEAGLGEPDVLSAGLQLGLSWNDARIPDKVAAVGGGEPFAQSVVAQQQFLTARARFPAGFPGDEAALSGMVGAGIERQQVGWADMGACCRLPEARLAPRGEIGVMFQDRAWDHGELHATLGGRIIGHSRGQNRRKQGREGTIDGWTYAIPLVHLFFEVGVRVW